MRPADAALSRLPDPQARSVRPAGVPMESLGETMLIAGTGWHYDLRPARDERGLCRPVAFDFPVSRRGGRHYFRLLNFPPVAVDIAPEPLDRE